MNISTDSTVEFTVSVSDTPSERSIVDEDNSESDDTMSVKNGEVEVNEAVENPSTTEHGGDGGDIVSAR